MKIAEEEKGVTVQEMVDLLKENYNVTTSPSGKSVYLNGMKCSQGVLESVLRRHGVHVTGTDMTDIGFKFLDIMTELQLGAALNTGNADPRDVAIAKFLTEVTFFKGVAYFKKRPVPPYMYGVEMVLKSIDVRNTCKALTRELLHIMKQKAAASAEVEMV